MKLNYKDIRTTAISFKNVKVKDSHWSQDINSTYIALNVHSTFRRCSGGLLYVKFTSYFQEPRHRMSIYRWMYVCRFFEQFFASRTLYPITCISSNKCRATNKGCLLISVALFYIQMKISFPLD